VINKCKGVSKKKSDVSEYNIKTNLTERVCEVVKYHHLVQSKHTARVLWMREEAF
jgi:hypothetical protein